MNGYIDGKIGEWVAEAQAVEAVEQSKPVSLQDYKRAILSIEREIKERVLLIGQYLHEIETQFMHDKQGGLESWVEIELGWTRQTAYNYRQVYKIFCTRLSRQEFAALPIPQTGWYELSKENTPAEAREEVLTRAQGGEQLSLKFIQHTIRSYRQRAIQEGREPAPAGTAADYTKIALPQTLCLFCRREGLRVYPLNAENARQGICEECTERADLHFAHWQRIEKQRAQ